MIVLFLQKTTSAGFRLAKALTVQRVVTSQPEKHGGDLLKITSGLLTEALAGVENHWTNFIRFIFSC